MKNLRLVAHGAKTPDTRPLHGLDRVSRVACTVASVLLAAVLAGCASPPPSHEPEAPVEKTVLAIEGVKHGPILVTPDEVEAGGMIRGTVTSQTPRVLVQAMLETPPQPMGEVPLTGGTNRPMAFTLPVPDDAFGTILVRAIDRNRLYTDKWIEVVAPR